MDAVGVLRFPWGSLGRGAGVEVPLVIVWPHGARWVP